MSGLPWFRMDSNIGTNDKIRRLVRNNAGWRAYGVYTFTLGWAVGHESNGHVPEHILPIYAGTPADARTLVDHELWTYHETGDGWLIRNFDTRQQTTHLSDTKHAIASAGGRKGACRRYHPQPCECWKEPQP